MNLLEHAIELNKQGFKVIPVNGNKQPHFCKWKQYQKKQTIDDIKNIFAEEGLIGVNMGCAEWLF